ncbi:MAG: cob(I)yrinic acid a,c-diamide adenosyltransferase [Bacteroidetes bacterium]|nr:cob(I)yrinic acid a,c-diamide adenosyltransferase [Bacteroidota bacterium]
MKIYTKTGDKGQTSLLGGTRVPKHHIRIEAYGTVDELNSYIGLLRDQTIGKSYVNVLVEIQDRLFTIGSLLACDPEKKNIKIPSLIETDITYLEKHIDEMEVLLPPMRSFVLPGGHATVSLCHVSRCICRRAERNIIHLSEVSSVPEIVIQYMNRLSDYLFMLSRKLAQDLNAIETPWIPRL